VEKPLVILTPREPATITRAAYLTPRELADGTFNEIVDDETTVANRRWS